MTVRQRLGRLQREILARVYAGVTLELNRSSAHNRFVINTIVREWEDERHQALERAIASLYQSHLLQERVSKDGTITLVLSDRGRHHAITADIKKLRVKKAGIWDRKWRVVLSDIPENRKSARDALRAHLKDMQFVEFQKSVWVHAFDCKGEIDFLIEFYDVRKYVRFGILYEIDNDLHLRKQFDLI
jgi:phenylacetic acid degradation operon negative regulatory protein